MKQSKSTPEAKPEATECFVCGLKRIPEAKYQLKDKFVYKCQKCFKIDSKLRNYQDCEVYSRIVGYLRPVKQWNIGKQEEYSRRKPFKT